MVRTSERGTFKRCPQKWWWGAVEGLAPKEPSKALWFGHGWHYVMADFYRPGKKRSKDWLDVWRNFCDSPHPEDGYLPADEMGPEFAELRSLGESMLVEYMKEYDGDPTWDVIQTEMSGHVMIPTWDGEDKFQYNFTFDGVYRDTKTKKIRLMEHKTAKAISIAHLSLDDQAGSYWAVAPTILRHLGVLSAKQSIQGVMYNFVKKGLPDSRPVGPDGYARNKPSKAQYLEALGVEPKGMTVEKLEAMAQQKGVVVLGDISKNQPTPMFIRHFVIRTPRERRTMVERMKAEHAGMEAMRSGALPVYKTPTRDCNWDCPFFTMCEVHEAGGDVAGFAKQVFRRRDAHEVYKQDRKTA